MFKVLTAAFGNANQKQETWTQYCNLWQGDKDFNTFWTEFLKLSQKLDHLEATLIDNLIKKSHYSIQLQLTIGNENFADLIQLARRC